MILVEGFCSRLAIGDDSARHVALIHLNAMGVELVLLERDVNCAAASRCAAAAGVASARASMFFRILS